MCTNIRSCIYMKTLNVSHQVPLVIEILLANTTAPELGSRVVSLVEALLLYVWGYLVMGYEHFSSVPFLALCHCPLKPLVMVPIIFSIVFVAFILVVQSLVICWSELVIGRVGRLGGAKSLCNWYSLVGRRRILGFRFNWNDKFCVIITSVVQVTVDGCLWSANWRRLLPSNSGQCFTRSGFW